MDIKQIIVLAVVILSVGVIIYRLTPWGRKKTTDETEKDAKKPE